VTGFISTMPPLITLPFGMMPPRGSSAGSGATLGEVEERYSCGDWMMSSSEETDEIGRITDYLCPKLGGSLWIVVTSAASPEYDCPSGHLYSQASHILCMTNAFRQTLWVLLRTLREQQQKGTELS